MITGLGSIAARIARSLLLLSGVAVFGVGLLVALVPGAGRFLPVDVAVELLGNDYLVVATISVVALAIAFIVATSRLLAGVDEATPAPVEQVQTAPHPGEEFDGSIDGGIHSLIAAATNRDVAAADRDRLRETATWTIVRTGGYSRSAAERHVVEGTWTDDPLAADFLADGDARRGSDGGLWTTAHRRRIHRTAVAIERLHAERDPPRMDGSQDGRR